MSFILYLIIGLFSGVLGGMGLGGGTVLIPALTIFLGVNQRVAQAANLISFLPMSLFALQKHKKSGLLKTEGCLYFIIPAMLSTVLFGVLMSFIPVFVLKKLFGIFLTALAVKEIFCLKRLISDKGVSGS